MLRRKLCVGLPLTVCSAILGLALGGHPRHLSAQEEHSPLAGTEAQNEQYPDASRWPESAQYEPVKEQGFQVRLGVAGMRDPRAVSFGVAAGLQAELPEMFSLGKASAVRVMEEEPAVPIQAARPEGVQGAGPGGVERDPMAIEQEAQPQHGDPMADDAGPGVRIVGPRRGIAALEAAEGPQPTSEKMFINYPLEYQDIPVANIASVLAIVGDDGRMLYVRKRNLPQTVDATEPTVEAEAAIQAVRQEAQQMFGDAEVQASDAELEIWVDQQLRGRLAWTFTLQSDSLTEPEARRYWVAAVGEPEVLNQENLIYHTHFGTVSGTLWEASPFQATGNRPLRDLQVTRSNGGTSTQVTGDDGRYGFPTGGGSAKVSATLSGPFFVVEDLAGPVMELSKSGAPSDPLDLNFGASGEFETAQVTAFHWSNITRDFASSILVSPDLENTPTRVNIDSSCNAFYRLSDKSINFFRAGGSCPNSAYSDVIQHELGHAIDHAKGGILNGGYSEGFGDAMTLLITRQPCVGREFFGAGTCLRDATDVDMWPPSPGEGVHTIGKRYAQFTWQLVQELKKKNSDEEAFRLASRLILAAAAGNPSDIPDAVTLSFLADDDDGDLTNGSPHFEELAAAADSRNIPRPPDPSVAMASLPMGFVWANNPTASNYAPSSFYAHNSAGGPITISRSGPGTYAVRFSGLGSGSIAPEEGGNVQVTPYGFGNQTAKVSSWSAFGSDFVVNVRCFDSAGAPVDTLYTVLVLKKP